MRRVLMAGLLCVLALPAAQAAEQIGQATNAKNEVIGTLGDLVRTIAAGDGVSGNETVKTGINSAALLKFLDSSNLSIGASSTIVLDRFVYNPQGNADAVVFNLTKGALRFVSGKSDPTNFAVKTQVATLGVLGTDFVAICDGSNRCAVVVAKGKVRICPHPELELRKSCSDQYDLDKIENFTIIEANSKNIGAKSIPAGLVQEIVRAVATGQDLTIAKIESAASSRFDQHPVPPKSASPG